MRGPKGPEAISPAKPQYSLPRTLKKWLGLHLTLAVIAFCYWTLREYQGDFFHPFFRIAQIIFPIFSAVSLPYIAWVDARMREPKDAYYLIGHQFTTGLSTLILKRKCLLTYSQIHEHLLGWIVKGFFTPLMFGFAVNNAHALFRFEPQDLSFQKIFEVSLTTLYFIDCIWAAAGYVFALRLTDSHIRSSQPTWQGWVAALICYEPFSRGVWPSYMAYESQQTWLQWLGPDGAAAQALRHSALPPEAAATLAQTLYVTWGVAILVLIAVYTWATMSFGLRFSNLTHRGIITSGPYRFLKHPAYLCKNLSWWLISMPFMLSTTWQDSLRHCAMLLLANAVYYWRAKTEEKHLLSDRNYQAYAASFHSKSATL
ncbi:MAG: isoprenylcysteine carboxyl methyltransferase [Betaproteobacteria bacterium]|nr:isoprenylcysteine carboxyl methyltransferase [Betaproteobacteria bacterium]